MAKLDISVKATVRRMLIQYPSLFQDKSDCFNHLFLTLGGGYDWHKGALVDRDPKRTDEPYWADESGVPSNDWERTGSELLNEAVRKMRAYNARKENHQVRFVLDNFDDLFDQHLEMFRRPYPFDKEYCNLLRMPENVKPDWRQACLETTYALIATIIDRERDIFNTNKAMSLVREFRGRCFPDHDKVAGKLYKALKDAEIVE